MVVNKRSKFSRMRGTRTHKWGAKKRHRKSGNRGGFGMAGTGKRAAHKKIKVIKEFGTEYFGKHGFYSIHQKELNAVNIGYLDENINKLATKEKDFFVVDACKLDYDKVLGGGKVNNKLRVICKNFSKKAEEKIKAAGGEVSRC